jgi:predicted membrane protein
LPSFLPPLPLLGEKKVSWSVYLILEFSILMVIFLKVLLFLNPWIGFVISFLFAVYTADKVADLKKDGKFFHRYIKDLIIFYWQFGRKRKTHYLNKGLLLKKEGE